MYSRGAQALIGHTNDNVRYQGRQSYVSCRRWKQACLTSEVGFDVKSLIF